MGEPAHHTLSREKGLLDPHGCGGVGKMGWEKNPLPPGIEPGPFGSTTALASHLAIEASPSYNFV
jgi:hypothetical protein